MSLLHIRGAQPSKLSSSGSRARQPKKTQMPRLSGLLKNVQKITAHKNKTKISTPSFGINNTMDQKCFQFFMDNFKSTQLQTRIPINTQECNNFLNKYNVKFVVERTQEISNSKVFISTHLKRKNMTTFAMLLPVDYSIMLVILILLKVDFGTSQIEFSMGVGKNLETFIYKSKEAGFRFYYDFIRLNVTNKRFIIVRSQS